MSRLAHRIRHADPDRIVVAGCMLSTLILPFLL
jgi:hypothetical protein